METTDFTTQDGRGSLQPLRRIIAQAVTESRGNAAKVTWLSAVLGNVIIDVTANNPWSRDSLDSNSLSNNTKPHLVNMLAKAASNASTYAGDYKTQLLQDLNDADTILTA